MTLKDQHVLVTGGAGFVGSHLVEELVRRGVEVTVVDSFVTGRPDSLSAVRDRIHFVQMDTRQAEFAVLLRDNRYGVIVHFASPAYVPPSVEEPYADFEHNLHTTIRLLELLRTEHREVAFILASSAAVYGNPVRLPMHETDVTVPISPYGVAKLAAERYVAVYSELYGIPAASLRFFSIYGPRQRKQVVYDLIEKVVRNPDAITMLGDGTETRDLIFVTDVARAVLTVLEHGSLTGDVYNVATGRPHTIRQVVETVAAVLRVQPRITFTGRVRAGDPVKWCAEIEKIAQIGFVPQVSLEEGVAETIAWYQREVQTE